MDGALAEIWDNFFPRYNVTLTKIEEGIHKYSVLQLICHGMNSYSIFRRWGNLGGKEDSFPHSFNEDLEAAVEAFEDRFLNLTGQESLLVGCSLKNSISMNHLALDALVIL